MYGPKWPFLLILIVYGPGVVVVNYLDRFVPWVELTVQRRLNSIFMSGVGLPTSMNIPRVNGLSTRHSGFGAFICLFLYRLKTPQMNIIIRALHFSCIHVTLDNFA